MVCHTAFLGLIFLKSFKYFYRPYGHGWRAEKCCSSVWAATRTCSKSRVLWSMFDLGALSVIRSYFWSLTITKSALLLLAKSEKTEFKYTFSPAVTPPWLFSLEIFLARFLSLRILEVLWEAPVAHANPTARWPRSVSRVVLMCSRLQELPQTVLSLEGRLLVILTAFDLPAASKNDLLRCAELLRQAVIAHILCDELTPSSF